MRAFTLIELISVLAILAVLIFLGLPTYTRFYSFVQFWGDGRKITSDLRGFHQQSISDHYDYHFNFVGNKNYNITKYQGATFIELIKQVEMQPTVSITSAPPTIIFHPLGNADPAGDATIVLGNSEGDTSTIRVRSTTGHVSIQ